MNEKYSFQIEKISKKLVENIQKISKKFGCDEEVVWEDLDFWISDKIPDLLKEKKNDKI